MEARGLSGVKGIYYDYYDKEQLLFNIVVEIDVCDRNKRKDKKKNAQKENELVRAGEEV